MYEDLVIESACVYTLTLSIGYKGVETREGVDASRGRRLEKLLLPHICVVLLLIVLLTMLRYMIDGYQGHSITACVAITWWSPALVDELNIHATLFSTILLILLNLAWPCASRPFTGLNSYLLNGIIFLFVKLIQHTSCNASYLQVLIASAICICLFQRVSRWTFL